MWKQMPIAARRAAASAGGRRQCGWLLMEMMIALTVLTVGVLGFLFSFQANFRATRELGSRDLAQSAIESAIETLSAADFASLYDNYNGATLSAPGLVNYSGQPATIAVRFDVNEPAMPAEYGPVADIDGDGAKTTLDASDSYVLLPVHLTLSYQMSYGPETRQIYMLLAPH